ncbi:hypothetical protein L1F06_007660 [Ectopseudomonas hydrolytica]|uniref:Transposase n=1 Tax=Ectopseudomonas hydrolytica TaxID=2493633 RepID=A0ABY5ACJ0_9GAMM|nr:hypothetical protein [Pseudomonas hydrolytica]USR41300.1 hypothetical protein L1F06_007660 [Pseudomonas hydrolytica]
MIVLAALMLLAKRFAGSLRSNWRAREAFAQLRPGLSFLALANAADIEQVKGRAPGSSERASSFRRTEARAKRTLEHPPDKQALAGELGQLFRPSSRALGGKSGMTRAEPLVLQEGSLPEGPRQTRFIVWLGERSE